MSPIDEAKRILKESRDGVIKTAAEIDATADILRTACAKIQTSWSGSFAGWHGSLYYRDYQRPDINNMFSGEWGGIHGIPDGWAERSPEEVTKAIDDSIGNDFKVKEFEVKVKNLRASFESIKNELVILFSAYPFDKKTEKEKELYAQVEKHGFGKSHGYFCSELRPKRIMTRDSEALQQGIANPVWLYYEGVSLEANSIIESGRNFIGLVDRLVRQLELKNEAKDQVVASDLKGLHSEIFAKCDKLYESCSYPEAVEKGFKVVRDKLRALTGHETGSEAFGKGKLHIKGAAAPNVDADFNEGVKFLTMAIDRFRNEKAHTANAKIDDSSRAYDYLRLSSLAMKLLDEAEIIP